MNQRRNATLSVYDKEYASRYDSIWQEHPAWAAIAADHVSTIEKLITPHTRWLDAGCGTGWFLSKFPGVFRSGFDLSHDMLEHARRKNPDAHFFQADLLDELPDCIGQWDLVTSTGQPWGYLSTIDEVETAARNMANWVAPGGVLMIQACDIVDMVNIPLEFKTPFGIAKITGVVWSFIESDRVHRNQLWPSLDQWIPWLEYDFEAIRVLHWPFTPDTQSHPRRVILASGKLAKTGTSKASLHLDSPSEADLPT